ncbi:MAG: hypothetical protein QW757_00415, partial [Candidatus Woesearchaeota archaeon]
MKKSSQSKNLKSNNLKSSSFLLKIIFILVIAFLIILIIRIYLTTNKNFFERKYFEKNDLNFTLYSFYNGFTDNEILKIKTECGDAFDSENKINLIANIDTFCFSGKADLFFYTCEEGKVVKHIQKNIKLEKKYDLKNEKIIIPLSDFPILNYSIKYNLKIFETEKENEKEKYLLNLKKQEDLHSYIITRDNEIIFFLNTLTIPDYDPFIIIKKFDSKCKKERKETPFFSLFFIDGLYKLDNETIILKINRKFVDSPSYYKIDKNFSKTLKLEPFFTPEVENFYEGTLKLKEIKKEDNKIKMVIRYSARVDNIDKDIERIYYL